MSHWTDSYFTDLYWLSTAELLTPEMTAAEVEFLIAALDLSPGQRILDCAAGAGRHARALCARGLGPVVALDRSLDYLSSGARHGPGPVLSQVEGALWCCGDLRALPFRPGAFAAALSWYSSLFYFDDVGNAAALGGLAAQLQRGGHLALHTTNPAWLAARPRSQTRSVMKSGAVVEEESRYDPATGTDHLRRRLTTPAGRVLEGRAAIRYYPPADLARMAEAAGLKIERLCGGVDGAPLSDDALDLIAVLRRT